VLVLSRKKNESIVVGNSIRITVVEVSGGGVRLGFEAPPDVSIYREEIHLEIARANRAAATTTEDEGAAALK
jgi:carbon storage regulator